MEVASKHTDCEGITGVSRQARPGANFACNRARPGSNLACNQERCFLKVHSKHTGLRRLI